jgi:hypothetical protein
VRQQRYWVEIIQGDAGASSLVCHNDHWSAVSVSDVALSPRVLRAVGGRFEVRRASGLSDG